MQAMSCSYLPPLHTHAGVGVVLQIRRSAASILPALLRSSISALEKGTPGVGPAEVARLFTACAPPLVECLLKEPDEELQIAMLDALGEVIEQVEPAVVGPELPVQIFAMADKLLVKAEERRKSREARARHEDFDEEEREALEEEDQVEEELFDQVRTACRRGACMQRL